MNIDALHIECHHDFEAIENAWRELEHSGSCTPYQRFDWVQRTHQQLPSLRQHQPCLVTVSRIDNGNATILALFPLTLITSGTVKRLEWLGDQHSNHLGGLYAREFAASLTAHSFNRLWLRIKTALPAFDLLWLRSQALQWDDIHSPFHWLGSPVSGANYYSQLVFPHHDWKTLAPTLRSKKARKRMRNEENRLRREADISWKTLDCPYEVERYLPILFRQRANRLQELGIPVEKEQAQYLSIYQTLLIDSIRDGNEHTSMMILKADNEMIAGMICFEWDNIIYPLLISMTASRYRQWSPGDWMLRLLFQKACDRQVKMVDIGPGDQDYKTSWCNAEVEQFETAIGETLRGKAAVFAIRVYIFTKRHIKNSPKLWKLFTRIRQARAPKNSGQSHEKRIQELG